MRKLLIALGVLFSLGQAHAESLVVTTCGTLPLAYAPGATRLDTVDVNGVKCTSASGGGGGGVVTQPVAALLNATVVGTGTFATQAAQTGTWNIATVTALTAITNALPAGANVIGQVTANAGTNLNTSALALESGGNLATIAGGVVSQGTALGAIKNTMVAGSVTTAAPTYTTGQISPLSLDTTGNVRVTGGVAQGSTTSGQTGSLVMAAVTTAAPAYTTAQTSPLSADVTGNLRVSVSPYGAAAAITASTTGTTGATTATLAGVASKTTYICGFTITSDATAALAGAATVTGTVTGTMNYIQNVGGATAAGILTQTFSPCIPASATNTGIAINSVAAGTGGNTAVTAWGFQL